MPAELFCVKNKRGRLNPVHIQKQKIDMPFEAWDRGQRNIRLAKS